MRSIWATVIATWALFAVLSILAWTRPQPATTQQTVPPPAYNPGQIVAPPPTAPAPHVPKL